MDKMYKRKILREQKQQVNKLLLIEQAEIHSESDIETYPKFDLDIYGDIPSTGYFVYHKVFYQDINYFVAITKTPDKENIENKLWVIVLDTSTGDIDKIWMRGSWDFEEIKTLTNQIINNLDETKGTNTPEKQFIDDNMGIEILEWSRENQIEGKDNEPVVKFIKSAEQIIEKQKPLIVELSEMIGHPGKFNNIDDDFYDKYEDKQVFEQNTKKRK